MQQRDSALFPAQEIIQWTTEKKLCKRVKLLQLFHPIQYCDFKQFFHNTCYIRATAVAQWLRCCATNWKVAGSIPAGVIGIFH